MREFVYYSSTAPTSGNFDTDLMKAGRLDIALHTIIGAFFLSNAMRSDVKLHLVFTGRPDPPKHLSLCPGINDEMTLSKKDLAWVIRKMLYKYRKDESAEVFPGYFIEKKGLLGVISFLSDEGKPVFVLDPRGEDIRAVSIPSNAVFVVGDQEGLQKSDLKVLKKSCTLVSIGSKPYFASQVMAVLQNELDRRDL